MLHGLEKVDAQPFLVMELVGGTAKARRSSRLYSTPEFAYNLTTTILPALSALKFAFKIAP